MNRTTGLGCSFDFVEDREKSWKEKLNGAIKSMFAGTLFFLVHIDASKRCNCTPFLSGTLSFFINHALTMHFSLSTKFSAKRY